MFAVAVLQLQPNGGVLLGPSFKTVPGTVVYGRIFGGNDGRIKRIVGFIKIG
jgi:hypothetical protein